MEARWEHFEHQADIGIRGLGHTPAAAFEQAALAMTAVVTDPRLIRTEQEVTVQCAAANLELLLVDWLNAVLYEMSTRRALFGRFAVELDGTRLAGRAWGERVDPARHRPAAEVKGATYAGLRVAREADGLWVAQCIVDV